MSTTPCVSFTQALWFWLKLGCISFGGPAGQIAIMQRELVENKRWISQARFNHALNYCMLLPGPEAQQLATYIGWLMHRLPGALMAGGLFVLPSLFILIALSWVFVVYGQVPAVASVLWGMQCAVAAIVIHALWRVIRRTMPKPRQAGILMALAALSFVGIAAFELSFIWIVLIAGFVGWLVAKRHPSSFSSAAHGVAPTQTDQRYVIDDHSPTPIHAQYSRRKMIVTLLIGLLLWGLSMGALVMWQGLSSSLTQMGWLFSKAALVTFGGAYAVLPYVTQSAVANQWLSPDQMMAGLALGETTPGPLIMIVAFVGFVGQAMELQRLGLAMQSAEWGLLFVGSMGALVATWFTFLPSFVFILAGGPLVESTHGKLGFTAPLQAISAAVIGAIAYLALVFVQHAASSGSGVDGLALALMAAAAFALFKLQWPIVRLIALCAVVGWLRHFWIS